MANTNMTATLKYATISAKKISLVSKLVRWKDVSEALDILRFTWKKWADILYKIIKSALNNAINWWQKATDLKIDTIYVSPGPKIKRIRFTSRSRISHYEKSRSFVKVILTTK